MIGKAAGPQPRESAGDAQHAERRHKRRHAEPRDHEAVDPTRRQADRDSGDDRAEHGELQRHIPMRQGNSILEQPRRDRAGKRQHRADRQIDAAGEDDHRHADRQAQIDRNLPQHVETVVDREKTVGRKAQRHDHQRKREQRLKPRNVLLGSQALSCGLGLLRFSLGQCRLQQSFFGRLAAGELGRHPAFGQNEDAIGDRQDLRQLRRYHDDAQAARGPARR